MNILNIIAVSLGAILLASSGIAQTTLPGGSDVDGIFAVGNSTNKGGLTITGQTGNAANPGISITGDGGVLFGGSYGTGQIPATGAGTRFMWYPKKAAIRAGRVTSTEWNDVNIGNFSVAFGDNVKALGGGAIATGSSTSASGAYSFVGGAYSSALGSFSMASGYAAQAYSDYSIAYGEESSAVGTYSLAIGEYSSAVGDYSVAFSSYVPGSYSAGFVKSQVFGMYSVGMGRSSIVLGDYAAAFGRNTSAASAYSFVTGRNNAVEGNATTWVETDPLFVIGNGTGVASDPANVKNRNALTVYKNGDVKITKRQGDILMGEFGNPE